MTTVPHELAPAPREKLAAALRGFGPIGLLAILVILGVDLLFAPLAAVLVLVWARLSRTPWREIGYVRPKNWIATIAGGIAFGIVFKLAMKAVVMPLLGADPINRAYQFLTGNAGAIPGMVLTILFSAGFAEETLFRGYAFERLGRLLGHRPWATALTVLISSIYFAALHLPGQGPPGAQQAFIVGLVSGLIYARTRQLPFLMVTHVAFDLTALALIYWGLETRVAHFIFK
jgi:membrane protease YdiL (CAAX protease family)